MYPSLYSQRDLSRFSLESYNFWEDMSPYPSLLLCPSKEAASTMFSIYILTRQEIEKTTSRTLGVHATLRPPGGENEWCSDKRKYFMLLVLCLGCNYIVCCPWLKETIIHTGIFVKKYTSNYIIKALSIIG